MHKIFLFVKKYHLELIISTLAFILAWWLMFSTFSYNNNSIGISTKAWSDFASHVPLIRSFSLGNNFPPQYPLFAGPPIKYHFLFYAGVGLLEKIGLRIDYALNIPSILGFVFLIIMIYLFAKQIFKSKVVGILSIFLFLFNGSLSFLNYFLKHPLSVNSPLQIFSNTTFPSFGPYDQSIVSAFWNFNIYTNQRHLALSYALSLLIIYLFLRFKDENRILNFKKSFFIGVIFGLSFMLNIAVFLMTLILLICLTIFLSKKRIYILTSIIIASLIALPQYLYIQSGVSTSNISINVGYLVNNLNLINFINYWFQNLGFHLILIPLGLFVANKLSRKIFISFLTLFIIGNLVQFSPEIAANHKFFNYFMIVGVMFSSYFLIYLWNKKRYLKPAVIILIFLLTFSGIIDFFPIYNDTKIYIADYQKNPKVNWILKNTKPASVFLNSQYLYDAASLAGRKVFFGWPYFAWSQGYDTHSRGNSRDVIFATKSKIDACNLLKENNINYIELNFINPGNDVPNISNIYKREFSPSYAEGGNIVIDVKKNCI